MNYNKKYFIKNLSQTLPSPSLGVDNIPNEYN